MMFLSGTFFPIDQMPQSLQAVARLIPLTYLADALRQVMVGGAAFAPLWVCAAVLARLAGGLLRDRVAQVPWQYGAGAALPALLADDLVERPAAAGLRRPGEVVRVGRVAERQQVLAVLVGRVAEQARARGRGRRRSPGTLPIPSSQAASIMFCGRLAEVEQDRQRRVGALRVAA